MYNYINKVCLGNDFTSIAQDMQSVMKYLAPPMEMYTPIMAEYMSGAPMPYLYDNMSSIFNAPNLYQVPNPVPSLPTQPYTTSNSYEKARKIEQYLIQRNRIIEERREKLKDFHSPVVFEGVPVVGKLNSVPESIIDGNYLKASTLWSLAFLNGPEELRSVYDSAKQIISWVKGTTYKAPYNYKEYQHPASFFRGTLLHNVLNPFKPNAKFKDAKLWLAKHDKSLIETNFGKSFLRKASISTHKIKTPIKELTYTSNNKAYVKAYKFIGKSGASKFTAKVMARTPVIGLVVSAVFEGGNAVHEINKGKDPATEIGKAGARWGSATLITGICGAVGSSFGPVGTVIGTSLGAILSAAVAKAIG